MSSTSPKISHGDRREATKSRRKTAPATTFFDTGAAKTGSPLKTKAPQDKLKVEGLALKTARTGNPVHGFTKKRFSQSILKKITDAVEVASKAGQPTRFVVDIDAAGMTSLLPEKIQLEKPAVEVEEVGELSPELQQALSAARERGQARAAEILSGDDMLSADAFALLLGTTRVTVNTKRQEGKVLGVDGAKRGFRYPDWQLDADGKPYSVLPDLHERLGGPWAVYRFLVQPHGELDGLTGREALQRGRLEDILAAVDSIGRDFR